MFLGDIMQYRQGTTDDINKILEIIKDAKEYLKEQGLTQWQGKYPDKSDIFNDIKNNIGYVLIKDNDIVGYFVLTFEKELAYEKIKGKWLNNLPYSSIHRTAIKKECRNQGLSKYIFNFSEELSLKNGYHEIKIDTSTDNLPMKHLIEKNGYHYCGTVIIDGDDKVAFQKSLFIP